MRTTAAHRSPAPIARPQIFKAGGITPFLLEQALGLDFAMRPRAAAEAGGDCACEAALDLPFSLQGRFGFSCAHVAALCEVVSAGAGGAARPLGELREAAAAALARRGVTAAAEITTRGIEPRLALAVSEAAARRVGAASGWRATPVGNVSFAWAFSPSASRLTVRVSLPFAAEGSPLELPLDLFRAGVPVHVSVGGVRAFSIDGEGRAVALGEAEAEAWRPEVRACAGAAARHVSGRVAPRGAACGGGRVLLLRVPGGAHELELEGPQEAGRL